MGLMGQPAFGGAGGKHSIDLDIPAKGQNYQLPVNGLQLSFSPYVPFDEVHKKFDF